MRSPAKLDSECLATPKVPVAVAVAPNGGRRTAVDHPAVPITPADLARTAAACLDAGASMIHVHVRDKAGRHLLDGDAYRAATAAIRSSVGDRLVVQITTEALGLYRPEAQMAVVREVRPEAASLALRELVPDDDPSGAAEAAFARFLEEMARDRVLPQIILYSRSDARRLARLAGRGLIPFERVPVLFVLGRYADGEVSAPAGLLPFLASDLPPVGPWMVCAFGPEEARCAVTAALLGGDARVGFENNLQRPDGSLAPDNAALVDAAAAMIRATGLPIASADDLRARWLAG